MTTTIQKWGNSLAVRIPKEMIRRLALKKGSGVVMHEGEGVITIRKQESKIRSVRKNDWKQYLIPVSRKKENVSGSIDHIVYGASR